MPHPALKAWGIVCAMLYGMAVVNAKKERLFSFQQTFDAITYTKAFFLPARGGELYISTQRHLYLTRSEYSRDVTILLHLYCTLVYISAYERGAEGESCSAVCRKASFPSQTKKVLLVQAR